AEIPGTFRNLSDIPEMASSVACAQTVLPHAPDEEIDAILAEEGFAREDHRRHAPVPGGLERVLVLRDHGIVPSGVRRDRGVELVQIETRPRRGVGEVRALVPAVDVAAPNDARDL